MNYNAPKCQKNAAKCKNLFCPRRFPLKVIPVESCAFYVLPEQRKRQPSKGEALLEQQLLERGIAFKREHKFHPDRKWRFDFILLPESLKIAIEVEGGTYSGGRHTRGKGYAEDCEKYNASQSLGWHIFRFTTGMVKNTTAIIEIQRAIINLQSRESL